MTDAPSFCADCGAPLERRRADGRDRPYCPDCDTIRWQNPKPFAGVAVVRDGQVLLVERGTPPRVGRWSLPAGYLEYDESPAACAVRELEEETGIAVDPDDLSILDAVGIEHPDGTRVVGTLYRARATSADGEARAGSDASAVGYWRPTALFAADGEQISFPVYRRVLRRAVDGSER